MKKHLDKNGVELQVGDSVLVPEPNGTDDMYSYEFVGRVESFTDEFVYVEDSDSDFFMIEPERLEIQ
jgi:hypothetical protein